MLVLARKENESIHIGDDVVITVIAVENGIVKLGIEAPKEITIVREELVEEVRQSNQAASKRVDSQEIAALSKLLAKQ